MIVHNNVFKIEPQGDSALERRNGNLNNCRNEASMLNLIDL